MIVRDESSHLPGALKTVLPLIDTWTVVDTGSADETRRIVQDTLGHLPGQLHEREWVSHQHNRTEAIALARDQADYLLLLDADLLVTGTLPPLTDDLYVAKLAGDFTHTLPFLISTKREWRYEGAAHPLLVTSGPFTSSVLETVTLTETRSVGPRSDKFARDAQALEAELNPRSIFYLAQSYRDLGYTEAAADMYRLRVRLSAEGPQEVFWACYQEALLRIETDWDRGVGLLLEAWQRRPSRAEPLWKLARAHRLRGNPDVALVFAQVACCIPMTTDQHFVLAWVYEWGGLMERALALQAVGDTDAAQADFRVLAKLDGEPGEFARKQLEETAVAA